MSTDTERFYFRNGITLDGQGGNGVTVTGAGHPSIIRLEGPGLPRVLGTRSGSVAILNSGKNIWSIYGSLPNAWLGLLHAHHGYGNQYSDSGTVQKLKTVLAQYPWLILLAQDPFAKSGAGRKAVNSAFDQVLSLLAPHRSDLLASAYTFTGDARSLEDGRADVDRLNGAAQSVQERLDKILQGIIPAIDARRLVLLQAMQEQMRRINTAWQLMQATESIWSDAAGTTTGINFARQQLRETCKECLGLLDPQHMLDIPFRNGAARACADLKFCIENLVDTDQEAIRRFRVAWRALHAYQYCMRLLKAREELLIAKRSKGHRRSACIAHAKTWLIELLPVLQAAKGLDGNLHGARPIGFASTQVEIALHCLELVRPDVKRACVELDFAMERF